MPKRHIDYSRTFIYRLTCKNPDVHDSYISFSTNIIQRKYKHKRECLDNYNQTKLIRHIRKYGGWSNWNFEVIEECVCVNENNAKEQTMKYISKYKPTLNCEFSDDNNNENNNESDTNESFVTSQIPDFLPVDNIKITMEKSQHIQSNNIPTNTDNKYVCVCSRSYTHRSSYYKHKNSCLLFQQFHTQNDNNDEPDDEHSPPSFSFQTPVIMKFRRRKPLPNSDITNNKSSTNIRGTTHTRSNDAPPTSNKTDHHHHNNTNTIFQCSGDNSPTFPTFVDTKTATILANSEDISSSVSELLTEQNEKLIEYIRQLMAHFSMNKKRTNKSLVKSLVFELLDQNKTLQKQIIELSKDRNIVVNNTNNNQFNLNFFLNEQCKDAVNLTDFVNSLEITLDDLTYTRNQGLVEGISKVMIDGLKQMDLYKRPIHCTDQKRDTIYIKDNHTWTRDEGNIRIRKAFVDIANKEYFAIKMWMDSNPDWESDSSLQDFHHKMVRNVLHEIQEDPIGERKILKNIEREIFIEK